METEANLVARYRDARRAFIAAAMGCGVGAIARVHPRPGPDGKPLFCDSAAFGPRDAGRGLLLLADADGAVTQFLKTGFVLPDGVRLVAVHALDPFARAWGRAGAPAEWPQKTLADITLEDLRKVPKPVVLDLEKPGGQTILSAIAAL